MGGRQHRTLVEEAVSGQHLHAVPFPNITDRDFWDGIPEDYREHLILDGEEALQAEWPALYLSDYREFSKTGNRVHFEDKYFARRRMLDALVLAEAAEDQGRFLDKALDGLWLILEETTWCLPAHNSYIRDARQYPVPSSSAPVVDLFAAETAATVGLAEAILRPALEKISPFISEYVNEELQRRIFRPYLSYHFWWMGDGQSKMLNWTPWITGNVLTALLSRPQDVVTPEEYDRILQQAAVSLDYFLDEYADDGCCDEGAQYFSHAGLMLYTALSLLEKGFGKSAGRDRIAALLRSPLLRNMASYIINVHVAGAYYVNYADCSPLAGRRTAGEFAFGQAAGVPALVQLSADDFAAERWQEKTLQGEISLYQRLRQAAQTGAMAAMSGVPSPQKVQNRRPGISDVFYPSTGLMVARDAHFVLACKAGDNGDSHNHNDVGSVILYKDGQPFLIDLGVGTYTAKTFSAERYSIWTMQSAYHNLPTFLLPDGTCVMQSAGEEFAASDVHCQLTGDSAVMTMDLAGAYAAEGSVMHYRRDIQFRKGAGIDIRDQADLGAGVRMKLSLMTYEEPILESDTRSSEAIFQLGSLGHIKAIGVASSTIEEIPITDARLGEMWKHSVYRILLEPAQNGLRLRIPE